MLMLVNPSRFAASGPPAGFPQVGAPTVTTYTNSSTSRDINMPATVNAGDLLIVSSTNLYSAATVPTTSVAPAGWSKLHEGSSSETNLHHSLFVRLADGTEDSTVVGFTLGTASSAMSAQCLRVTDWFGALAGVEFAAAAIGLDDSPNPPNLAPSWGALNSLWLGLCGLADDDGFATSAPAGFAGLVSSPAGGGMDSSTTTVFASREVSAASLDPSVFTLDQVERWSALTLAVRPAA